MRAPFPIPVASLLAILFLASCTPRDSTVASDPGSMNAPPEPTSVEPDSTAGKGTSAIRVMIPENERIRLVERATADLDLAREIADRQPESAEMSDEDRTRRETLVQYIESAQSLLDAGDVGAAADLAQKARLLATDLDQ